MGDENTELKRSISRYLGRLFNNKDRSKESLAYAYYKMDELLSFMEREQAKLGTELLETDFKEVFLKEDGVKVFLDEDCGILIDPISKEEEMDLLLATNRKVLERDVIGQLKK